jgi:hypothetical protein
VRPWERLLLSYLRIILAFGAFWGLCCVWIINGDGDRDRTETETEVALEVAVVVMMKTMETMKETAETVQTGR